MEHTLVAADVLSKGAAFSFPFILQKYKEQWQETHPMLCYIEHRQVT